MDDEKSCQNLVGFSAPSHMQSSIRGGTSGPASTSYWLRSYPQTTCCGCAAEQPLCIAPEYFTASDVPLNTTTTCFNSKQCTSTAKSISVRAGLPKRGSPHMTHLVVSVAEVMGQGCLTHAWIAREAVALHVVFRPMHASILWEQFQ